MPEMKDESLERVDARIREAFPESEGLSATRSFDMYGRLREVAEATAAPRRRMPALAWRGLALAGVLGAIFAGVLFANAPSGGDSRSPLVPVPQRALAALEKSASVLHYRSAGLKESTRLGNTRTTEELWLDADGSLGRLVTLRYEGDSVVETMTLVANREGGERLVERAGKAPQRERFEGESGPWWRELDKVSAYRNMLESGVATVTGEGVVDGKRTYQLSATLADFPAPGYEIRMAAEIGAEDYLPIRWESVFMRLSDGKTIRKSERTFERVEMVPLTELPAAFFTSADAPAPSTELNATTAEPSGVEPSDTPTASGDVTAAPTAGDDAATEATGAADSETDGAAEPTGTVD